MAAVVSPPAGARAMTRIRCLLIVATVVAALAVPVTVSASSGATRHPNASPAVYYLSLGDSLAQGVQPNSTGASVETNQGYADDLFGVERFRVPGLQLEKLGCPGETTTTMLTGGICPYAQGNQVAAAVAFLATHKVAFITIDIGANNVDGCVTPTGLDPTCVEAGFAAAGHDLPLILGALRGAAPTVPIYGMNYYDPFLSEWLSGAAGQALATESVTVAGEFNADVLAPVYAAFGAPVADVASAFQTTNFNLVPFLRIPVNVLTICGLTWMCAPAPVGPNIHANVIGYVVIASTFARTIGKL